MVEVGVKLDSSSNMLSKLDQEAAEESFIAELGNEVAVTLEIVSNPSAVMVGFQELLPDCNSEVKLDDNLQHPNSEIARVEVLCGGAFTASNVAVFTELESIVLGSDSVTSSPSYHLGKLDQLFIIFFRVGSCFLR